MTSYVQFDTWQNSAGTVSGVTLDSLNRVTGATMPFAWFQYPASTTKAAGWNAPSSGATVQVLNRGGHFANNIFTCPVAGDYYIAIGGFVATTTGGDRFGGELRKNNVPVVIFGNATQPSGDFPFPWNSIIVNCAAGDQLTMFQFYSPATVTFGNGGFYSFNVQYRLLV